MSSPAAPLACPAGQLPAACGVGPRGHVRGHSTTRVHTTLCMDSEGGCDTSSLRHSVLLAPSSLQPPAGLVPHH
eukprot:907881-Amphidinium_carterae.2